MSNDETQESLRVVPSPSWQSTGEIAAELSDFRMQIALIEADDRKAADSIDKIVMVGGPAGILASLTFMKDIAPSPAPGTLRVLVISWVVLLVAAFLATASLLTTRAAARAYARMMKQKVQAKATTTSASDFGQVRPWNTATKWLNRGGLVGVLTGMALLLRFAQLNLPAEKAPYSTATKSDPNTVAAAEAIQSVLAECVRTRCAVVFGYEYDVPGRPAPRVPSPAKARSGAKP